MLLCRTAPGRPGVRDHFVIAFPAHGKTARRVHRFSSRSYAGDRSATSQRWERRRPYQPAPNSAAAPSPAPGEGGRGAGRIRGRRATGTAKVSIGQPRSSATLRSARSGLTDGRVADRVQHRQIGDRVAVRAAVGQVVPAAAAMSRAASAFFSP